MENLKYFLTHYRDRSKETFIHRNPTFHLISAIGLMKRQKNIMQLQWRENWYPFSTVGVNVTDLVCRVVGVYRRKFNAPSRSSKHPG